MAIKTLIFIYLLNLVASAFIGERCKPSSDLEDGTCTLVTDCEIIVSIIKETGHHQFNRCGFSSRIEIVCCPGTTQRFGNNSTSPRESSTTTIRPRTTLRAAERACQDIGNNSIPPLALHIIGGEVAALGEFPHMVGIGYERDEGLKFDCGGSLISDQYVLTAAHCIDNLARIEPSVVRIGVVEIGENEFNAETDMRIARIIKHPDYTNAEKYHDLALLRLTKSIEITSVTSPACLYTEPGDPSIPLAITGWGQISNTKDARSTMLLKANVTVVPRETCSSFYTETQWRKLPRGISSEQLCAGDKNGLRDTCQGDSGGPLQGLTGKDSLYRIVGITSFGRGCGSKVPGVYTRVSNYLDWIESVVWPNSR